MKIVCKCKNYEMELNVYKQGYICHNCGNSVTEEFVEDIIEPIFDAVECNGIFIPKLKNEVMFFKDDKEKKV